MHGHAPRRRLTPTILALWAAALLAVCCSATALGATASSTGRLAGTWSGSYAGAFSGTFVIHWKRSGSKLHGSIALSKPKGTYPITGKVRGTAIQFGAVAVGATYTGSVSGKTMSGSYKTPQGGGSWKAHKTS